MTKQSIPTGIDPLPDDAILPATRLIAAGVIPFLIAAFLILYLRPAETGERFAWKIASPLTAALMGAGYLGGAYFFARVLIERRWHRVAHGFPPVAAFTAILLTATLLHWDTFDPAHWPFLVWLVIYIVTPIAVPLVWWRNRSRDPGTPEPDDLSVPPVAGRVTLAAGVVLLASAVYLFCLPEHAAGLWPWPLTPLTARVLAGWQTLLGVGALAMSRERRWSGWRIPLQSILIWQGLLLPTFYLRRDAFGTGGPLNWFTLYTLAGVIAAAAFLIIMERRRRSNVQ